MQDDVLCAVFTPREAFLFAAAMRLKISEEERVKKVDELIVQLGLTKC
jgi:ABC-type multidrug transport system ATPase subunit